LGCLGYMCCTCIRIGWPMDWDGTVMVWYGMTWDEMGYGMMMVAAAWAVAFLVCR